MLQVNLTTTLSLRDSQVETGGEFPAVADSDGEWAVQMIGIRSTKITVSGEDGPPVVAHNVSGGDVFFCSGS